MRLDFIHDEEKEYRDTQETEPVASGSTLADMSFKCNVAEID